jgi:hypothetical protein
MCRMPAQAMKTSALRKTGNDHGPVVLDGSLPVNASTSSNIRVRDLLREGGQAVHSTLSMRSLPNMVSARHASQTPSVPMTSGPSQSRPTAASIAPAVGSTPSGMSDPQIQASSFHRQRKRPDRARRPPTRGLAGRRAEGQHKDRHEIAAAATSPARSGCWSVS